MYQIIHLIEGDSYGCEWKNQAQEYSEGRKARINVRLLGLRNTHPGKGKAFC